MRRLIPHILAAERAMVFISVTWSAPERNARREFEEAVTRWETELPDHAIEFFRLEIDEDLVAGLAHRAWFRCFHSHGRREFALA